MKKMLIFLLVAGLLLVGALAIDVEDITDIDFEDFVEEGEFDTPCGGGGGGAGPGGAPG